MPTKRRTFLKQMTLASAATQAAAQTQASAAAAPASPAAAEIAFPRVFAGRRLTAIAFPLGGVCAGCVSLGGRGHRPASREDGHDQDVDLAQRF